MAHLILHIVDCYIVWEASIYSVNLENRSGLIYSCIEKGKAPYNSGFAGGKPTKHPMHAYSCNTAYVAIWP